MTEITKKYNEIPSSSLVTAYQNLLAVKARATTATTFDEVLEHLRDAMPIEAFFSTAHFEGVDTFFAQTE